MRVSLVKFADFLDFQEEEDEWLTNHFTTTVIRWNLPKLTDEQEAAIRDELNSQFGPQDSCLVKEKVVEWKIGKRKRTQWYFKLVWTDHNDEFWMENCIVKFDFHNGHCKSGSYVPFFCEKSPQIISKGADVEILLQIGNSEVLFNDLTQEIRTNCMEGSERFYQYGKSVPVKILNQLYVHRDEVSVTVFGTFPEGNQGMDLRSNFDWSASPKPNWKSSDLADTDVSIKSWGSGEPVRCHSNFFTRNSRVLSELLVSPTRKPFEVKLREVSKIQVEAFLSYQYSGVTDKILETLVTSLGVLKAAERFETGQMWTDTIKGLLDKDTDWFEGDVALKLADFLGNCSKREEDATQNLIPKISQKLGRRSQPVEVKSGNKDNEDESGVNCETRENIQVEESREAGDNEAESRCHNLGRNKIRSAELAQLKLKLDPVSLLKFVQCYQNEEMWNDIILTLLEKDPDWFERDLALELKTFLDSCAKRDEEATKKLFKTLSQFLEQPKPFVETKQAQEEKDQNGEIAENTMNSHPGRAKRRKVSEEDPDQLIGKKSSSVGILRVPVAVTLELRRSARLKAGKREKGGLQPEEEPRKKALRLTARRKETVSQRVTKTTKRKPAQTRKRGPPSKEVSWTEALQVGAENERKRNASKSGGAGPGPRDIWKDPLLSKISIFPDIPDPEVKVEKVEPPEEDSEDSPGMDVVEIKPVIQDQDCVAVTVKEETPIPMDGPSAKVEDSVGCGVIMSCWSLRPTADENV